MDQPFEVITLEQLDSVTQGETMQRLARSHEDEMMALRDLADMQCLRAKQAVKRMGEVSANQNVCGLRAVAEIPLSVRAAWRAKFVLQATKANVKGVTGLECWQDKDFMHRFRKLNPEFFYKERKKGNSVLAPGTGHLIRAGKYTNVREAAAA